MQGYLLDTNVISETVRKQPDARVTRFLISRNDLWICTVSVQELVFGAERIAPGEKREMIAKWISDLAGIFSGRILPLDWRAAALAGRFRSMAIAAGQNGVDLDAAIAGIAVSNELVLATRNTKHFVAMEIGLFDPWGEELSGLSP